MVLRRAEAADGIGDGMGDGIVDGMGDGKEGEKECLSLLSSLSLFVTEITSLLLSNTTVDDDDEGDDSFSSQYDSFHND